MLAYITSVCSVCCLIFLKKRRGMGHLSLKGATVSFFETKDGVLSQIIEEVGFSGTFWRILYTERFDLSQEIEDALIY